MWPDGVVTTLRSAGDAPAFTTPAGDRSHLGGIVMTTPGFASIPVRLT
jgi:hypothetical protein